MKPQPVLFVAAAIAAICFVGLNSAATQAKNLLSPVSEASTQGGTANGWSTYTWTGSGRFDVVEGGRDGGKCLLLEADGRGGDISWIHIVELEPDAEYRLTAWIKTENLEAIGGRGVAVHLDGDERPTPEILGTNDWTKFETTLVAQQQYNRIHCSLGGWGAATGRVWLDGITLVRADEADADAVVRIDGNKPGTPINPFIYSQFIEHLGRCVYGGIWAEMLEDRKFFYPVTDQYNPYRSQRDAEYPVVAASPWEVLGSAGSVTMVKDDPFVGDHTPQIADGSGIRQNDLGLVEGKKYVGYVWLHAPDGPATVRVSLIWGEGDDERQTAAFGNPDAQAAGAFEGGQPGRIEVVRFQDDYAQCKFEFTPGGSTDKGRLAIEVHGAPVLVGTASLMPADNVRGMRADTLALLKQLDAPMYRWPGGNFVSGYDWRDGIGPRDRRPPRANPAWTGVEHNDMGMDEFIDFCREVGAEPMVTVNTGFGDDYSAAQQVEYANGSDETIGGSWRVKNGHREPFNVKYWCVGNEMWGDWQLGHMPLGQYTRKHNLFARAMRRVDPEVRLIGSGDLGTQSGPPNNRRSWSRGMLEGSGDYMEYIAEHFYRGRVPWGQQGQLPVERHVGEIRSAIREKADGHRELQLKEMGRDELMPIAMTEWNYWHRDYVYGELGCEYDLADALGIAAGLHEYFRQGEAIQMAFYAQTVNVIGAIKTTKTDAFFDTTALPLMIYRREFGRTPLDVSGDYSEESLDVAAAWTEDGSAMTIGIVNPSAEERTIRLDIAGASVGDSATVWCIAGDDPKATNSADEQPVSVDEQKDVAFGDTVTVPGYSVSVYRVAVE